ncbi:MAG TPA: hypothetical protein PKC49_08570 [Phycisphaerae bacterium]|nr:hypothetical protein [Phycisphaerae bacterium]
MFQTTTGVVALCVLAAAGGSRALAAQVCQGIEDINEAALEPACGQPVDTVNGGCGSVPVAFIAIACGQSVCGTGYYDGVYRDTDWFLISPDFERETYVTWGGMAEFDHQAFLLSDPNEDCYVEIVAWAIADAGPIEVAAKMPPGRNYLWVAPGFTNDPFPCGREYSYRFTCSPVCQTCTADLDGDCAVQQSDLGILLSNFGASVPPGAGGDYDGDGVVSQADLGHLLSQFGCQE